MALNPEQLVPSLNMGVRQGRLDRREMVGAEHDSKWPSHLVGRQAPVLHHTYGNARLVAHRKHESDGQHQVEPPVVDPSGHIRDNSAQEPELRISLRTPHLPPNAGDYFALSAPIPARARIGVFGWAGLHNAKWRCWTLRDKSSLTP